MTACAPFSCCFSSGMRWRRSETKSRLPTTYAVWMPSAFKKGHQGRHRREQLLPAGGDAHAVQLFYVGFRRLGGVVAQKEKIHILPVPLHKGHGPLDGIVPHRWYHPCPERCNACQEAACRVSQVSKMKKMAAKQQDPHPAPAPIAGILHGRMPCCKRPFPPPAAILTQQCPVSRGKGRLLRIISQTKIPKL